MLMLIIGALPRFWRYGDSKGAVRANHRGRNMLPAMRVTMRRGVSRSLCAMR
jgi:hypothetical protein